MESAHLLILVVDDEDAHIEAIRRAFEGVGPGADIDAVGTLKDYREYLATHSPDLVLMDLNLPDGRAVEILKYPPEEAPFPILVMTAFGSQQIVVEVMKAGALDYVVKSPEAFSLLPRTVERALQAWQLILKHKQSEVALRESEARYRNLYESMMDAFARVSMDGRILEFNQAYQAMLGYSGEQLKHLTYMELTPVRWHAIEARMIEEQVLARGYSYVYEKEYRKQDGTIFPVELRTFLVHDAAGQPASMWAIVRDITERKRVEESHARLVTAVEQEAETILITDAKGIILYVNPAFERTTGYSREEVL